MKDHVVSAAGSTIVRKTSSETAIPRIAEGFVAAYARWKLAELQAFAALDARAIRDNESAASEGDAPSQSGDVHIQLADTLHAELSTYAQAIAQAIRRTVPVGDAAAELIDAVARAIDDIDATGAPEDASIAAILKLIAALDERDD